jgi:predicted hydrocarbon binding protein
MPNEPARSAPDFINQAFMEGVEEIIGMTGMHALANQIHDLRYTPDGAQEPAVSEGPWLTQQALEGLYGARGGRGIALRGGRSSFKYILRLHGARLGLTDLNFRLLPAPVRLKTGLTALAGLLSESGQQKIVFSEEDGAWTWRVEDCVLCQGRKTSEPACAFHVGLLQEFLTWASGGKVFAVRETECRAMGKPECVFRVDQKSLD